MKRASCFRRRASDTAHWIVVGCCLLVACDDGTSPPSDSEIGIYALTTVHGAPPPAVVFADANDTTTILSGQIELKPDSLFVFDLSFAQSLSGVRDTVRGTAEGPYGRDGDLIWFTFNTFPSSTTDTATYADGVITVENPEGSLVFERLSP